MRSYNTIRSIVNGTNNFSNCCCAPTVYYSRVREGYSTYFLFPKTASYSISNHSTTPSITIRCLSFFRHHYPRSDNLLFIYDKNNNNKSWKLLIGCKVMADKQNLGSEPRITFVQFSGQLRLTLYIRYYAPICHGLKCSMLLYCIWATWGHVILPSIIFERQVMMGQSWGLGISASSCR